ncbi:MAG: flagellin [Phycisphaerae bacterium]|nr:flagellin [Phycisphaerae bacterium]
MARINTNVPAIVAQRTLRQSQRELQVSLERLSSGLRINRGADDPAGLISSELLRAEISGIEKSISNSQRAINIIATAEASLNEVASLLTDIQGLIVEIANDAAMSEDEKQANQLQINSAIESITRIANTASFAGRKLINGELDYITSGIDPTMIGTLTVHRCQFGTSSYIPVDVAVTVSAQHAQLQVRNSAIPNSVNVEIRGSIGTTVLSFTSGTSVTDIMAAVNRESQASGVEAVYINSANPASGMAFQSIGFGSDEFVEVTLLPGSGDLTLYQPDGTPQSSSTMRSIGRDAVASINGAQVIGRGLDLNLQTRTLELSLTLDNDFGIGSTTFAVTGGGALFQLGPDVNTNQQVNMGIQSVAASRLGNPLVGYLSQVMSSQAFDPTRSLANANTASQIVNEANRQVSVLRGRLGAFERNTLQTNIRSLEVTMENLISSESAIRDADFAHETSQLTRNQILVSAGTSVLALANSSSQSVLALLGG